MILYIAEKPSLGRAIAEALPKPHRKQEGFIRVANGDCVSWCIGHLLEQAEPDAYDPDFKQWKLEHLPIVPDKWQLKPRSSARKQLAILKKLIREADQLVHAGDPDREGQLLVDELINYVGVAAEKQRAIQRCLISDLNLPAVRRALESLRSNRDFVPLSTSALARSRADWLYGINMTRACTVQGRKAGYQGVLSVGRVQTPVLGLVVRRDQAIESFVSRPFYEVLAHVRTQAGEPFTAKWKPSEACAGQMDEEGRVLSRNLAEHVVTRITDKPALVTAVESKKRRQPPPLPYNLSALQIDAAKRFGLTAQQVLDNCQSLYERHKLITYPRSDCRYLPVEHHQQASQIVVRIGSGCSALRKFAADADCRRRSRAWNDGRVDAHHAIIPTMATADVGKLNRSEQQLYELIARQYLCQFFPDHQFLETRVELTIEGGLFVARARQVTEPGWKPLLARKPKPDKADGSAPNEVPDDEPPTANQNLLPALSQGQQLHCQRGELLEKQTQPPEYFTDATLLAAMTGIARFVEDADIRKILRETDGLGTEATRAGIIELLFKRGFLIRQGKQIRSTTAGRALIDSLPKSATLPDMTAHWESLLAAVSRREASYSSFMVPLGQRLEELISQTTARVPVALKGVKATKPASARGRRRKTGPASGRRSKTTGRSGKKQRSSKAE